MINNNKNVPLPFGQKDNYLLQVAIIYITKIVTDPIALDDFRPNIQGNIEVFQRSYPWLTPCREFAWILGTFSITTGHFPKSLFILIPWVITRMFPMKTLGEKTLVPLG